MLGVGVVVSWLCTWSRRGSVLGVGVAAWLE